MEADQSNLPLGVPLISHGLWCKQKIQPFFEQPVRVISPGSRVSGVIGWGLRSSGKHATRLAERMAISCLLLEDGFLRSVGLGKTEPPLSIVVDDLGIYYDARLPSRLESLISTPLSDLQRSRAHTLMAAWRGARVSKYNHAREFAGALPTRYVLVVDQTLGDASIQYGLADSSSFTRMLDAALAENPDCMILLKVHPDVVAGYKRGHFDLDALAHNPRVQVLGGDAHPVGLIEHAQALYVVTSQMGFEGLLWGKPVRCFGMPFYAGWGRTRDDQPAPERRAPVALENLVYAALVAYPRYLNPETGQRCEAEALIEWMGLQRQMRECFPSRLYALNFSRWKKPIVRDFFQGSEVVFVRRAEQVPSGASCVLWGRREVAGLQATVKLIRLEDGFLRSVGLGADLVRPLSWVMDDLGIYYDATTPSRLEHLLQTHEFDEPLRQRARSLREAICVHGLTKYNVGAQSWTRPEDVDRVILVPGQVETDASLAWGAPGIRRNIDLLRAVRQANPDAYVIYKPHPDVVAGLRNRGQGEDEAAQLCNEVLVDCSMGQLLDAVDEVHVLTSLAGFEALLRGKRVETWGQPFYAGWGLTRDHAPVARRIRQLTLNELVAGVLILYPTYVSRTTGRFCTPERALQELLTWREQGASRMPLWRKALRCVLRLAARK